MVNIVLCIDMLLTFLFVSLFFVKVLFESVGNFFLVYVLGGRGEVYVCT